MGKQYAVEFKESILKRILPPNNGYIPEISRETGVPVDTLYTKVPARITSKNEILLIIHNIMNESACLQM